MFPGEYTGENPCPKPVGVNLKSTGSNKGGAVTTGAAIPPNVGILTFGIAGPVPEGRAGAATTNGCLFTVFKLTAAVRSYGTALEEGVFSSTKP